MPVALLLPLAADPTPRENDVVAGWGGFAVFIGLCLAVALIAFFLVRSLRTARTNFGVETPSDEIPSADAADASGRSDVTEPEARDRTSGSSSA